jgi:hypothetical protein
MPRITFGVLLCSTLLMAQSDSTRNAVIRLERTACYGTFPAYKVTIYGTGEVIYEGKSHVRVVGTRRAQIPPHTAAQLITDCEDYLDFAEHNKIERPSGPKVEDGSDTLFTLTRNGADGVLRGVRRSARKTYGIGTENRQGRPAMGLH